jgi:hypothetical protein
MAEDNQHDESSDAASENEYDEADIIKDERDDDVMAESNFINKENDDGGSPTQLKKPKLDPRDPLRPRRKKARRACFACQRAHLTCGMFQCYLMRRQRVLHNFYTYTPSYHHSRSSLNLTSLLTYCN